ncbi:MAG: hypothetical protein IPG72_04400 [Ardenticatenales bacterium]|nr:hypothetical protein [Ardenticatenales bacterium]
MFRVFAALLSLVAALAIAGCTEQADRMPGAALPQTTDGDQAAVAPPDTAAGDDSAAVDIGAAVSDTAADVGRLRGPRPPPPPPPRAARARAARGG